MTPEEDPDGAIRDLHDLILAIWDNDPASVSKISARATESTLVFNGVKYPKAGTKLLPRECVATTQTQGAPLLRRGSSREGCDDRRMMGER